MLHTAIEFSKPDYLGVNAHMLHLICKCVTSRKFGSIFRYTVVFLLLFGVYLTSFYVLNNSEEEGSLEDIGNETEGPSGIFKQNGGTRIAKPVIPNELVFLPPAIKFGETLLNCGLPRPCTNGEFSIHIYTGKDHKDEPRLCLDGKYILSRDVNGAGRGINAVVVDNMTKTVTKVSHFDTYDKESTSLETLLLTLRPGDIVILLTFDEPTRRLSRVARLLLYELGSALIQNLSYRGSWYLVTQKGISGFTPFEALHVVESSGWPKHHDVHFCVPFQIQGHPIHPDPLPRTNQLRVEFCQQYGQYPLFCDADVINEPLYPAVLMKHSRSVSKIYNTPIIVISGENVSYLPVTLETIMKQSGINPSLVVVFYLPQHSQIPRLCDLFGFMSVELSPTFSYCERVKEAFETANLLFPDSKELVLLGENVVLAPDFLFYMGQTLPLLELDPSITSISAFNENGFQGSSDDLSLLYRVESFTGLGVVVRKDFFQKHWCSNDSETDPLYITDEVKGSNIVPEISRVLIIPLRFSEDYNISLWSSVLAHKRAVSYEDNVPLENVEKMTEVSYEEQLNGILSVAKSLAFGTVTVSLCNLSHTLENTHEKGFCEFPSVMNISTTRDVYSIYVHQKDSNDMSAFQFVCQCFDLLYYPPYSPRGLYLGVLRFTWQKNRFLAVGSSSPFYRHKPSHVQPLIVNYVSCEN